mmetsp:Transcript_12721/g.24680  ORF Transcript_12721/g.24680 Transcript_12721/m.24680 type:complete len:515 (+) Transcript_12721:456-2000(+)|eukprot:CAMPEP_0171487286 /NCGR_PEP_ID=MMETSP0958-20121227/1560_1 /TAXON_ID=87120 /ORGANISM="Aurantiochytrium limacinum, Strain ATCCMYA-1381" /LENGTH=514 /DNA_ID=CAMNT_0012020257 /DNA_START=319 /DNA_END=1863 /DNA_ORIENTATION=-
MAAAPSSSGSRSSMGDSSGTGGSEDLCEPEKPWRFAQWFKKMPVEDSMPDSDLLSAVEFDATGSFLASGDRGGRVVVLRSDNSKGKIHYTFHCEFQSHEPDFDYVRSIAIEERISKIKFLPQTNDCVFMLTTNDKAIKMWKLQEREVKYTTGFNTSDTKGQPRAPDRIKSLRFPQSETVERLVTATPKREYSPEIHKFNIHSLVPSCDGQSFMSADNLSINLWNLNVTDVAFQVVNLKPMDMTKLMEYITAADLDQVNSNSFIYGTNRGLVRLCDMREKALCDSSSLEFHDPALDAMDKQNARMHTGAGGMPGRPFLADLLRNISDVKFAPNNLIVARDFMSLKIWDVRQESRPVEIIPVHDYLSPKLWDLYENEYLYESFDVSVSAQGIMTGSYNSYFHIYDLNRRTDTLIEASKAPYATMPIIPSSGDDSSRGSRSSLRAKKRLSKPGLVSLLSRKKKKDGRSYPPSDGSSNVLGIDPDTINYEKRITQLNWHPNGNAVAVAGENNLFIYAR